MAARGAWLLQRAVRLRWNDAGLDAAFRLLWPLADRTRDDVFPFNDSEARAASNHPRPYCVIEYGTPIHKGNSTGRTDSTEIVYQDHPVNPKIHASTKADAEAGAILVADAFVKKGLTITQDRFISTLVDPDFCVREGDKTWCWVLQFRFRIEGDVPALYT